MEPSFVLLTKASIWATIAITYFKMKSKQDDNNGDLQQTKENDQNSHTQSTNVWLCNKIGKNVGKEAILIYTSC